jgi:hypothetical protein
MHKFFSVAALAAFTMLLSGCGGSSFSASSSSGGTKSGTLTTLSVSSSIASIPADGSASATITALAADGSGKPLPGIAVSFTANGGGSVVANQTTTDANGHATATLSLGTATPGSSITVTATSGTVTGTTVVTVAAAKESVSLQTSSPQITSDNTTPAVITAFVKDANNNFVPGVVVHFQSTSGGLTVNAPTGGTAGMTDATGAATASLSTAGDPTNRAITITAAVGASSSTIVVNVVGTTLSLTGPSSLVLGTSGTYSVALADAGKKAIASQTVTLTSSAGNSLSAPTVTTDSTGHASFTVAAAKAGADSISAAGLGITSSESVTVSNQQFQFSAPAANALIPLSIPVAPATTCTPNTAVTVNWKASGAPVATGTSVNFASTRGTLSASSSVTDGNGNATVMICATSAGPATLSATGAGVSATQNISFVSTTPNKVDLQPNPSTVAITGQSTLTAIVRDASGNLVQGQVVDFTLTDVTGGSLNLASATTDVEGVAQTIYTAGNTASASNGVSVTATVHGTAITRTATLTVDGSPLHITLGTGNKLLENSTQTAFIMNWFVSVLDAAGHPVPSSSVSLTVHSASRPFFAYFKGAYIVCGGAWVVTDGSKTAAQTCGATPPVPYNSPTACLNEDVNLTGVYDAAEDINHNNKLDPGDVALASPGLVTTGADGTGTFQVIYPEDHANWVQVTLTATASVSGTESSTSTTFVLPILATYVTTTTSSPPGVVSPYGTHTCTDPN